MAYRMEAGGVYRIEVQGPFDETAAGRLGGLSVTSPSGGTGNHMLEGRLADQAALVGVLQALLQLHLSVISVKLVAE